MADERRLDFPYPIVHRPPHLDRLYATRRESFVTATGANSLPQ